MGGSVFREDAGLGFANGGAASQDILAQINAIVNAHQGIYPYGKTGLYGTGMGKAGPYGSTLMQPGSQRLMTAPPVRQEPPYDARQAMRDVRDISQMPKTISEGYSGLKSGLIGAPEQTRTVTSPSGQTTTEVTQQASSGLLGRGGEFNLRESGPARTYREVESWVDGLSAPSGNARGGAIRPGLAVGGLPYSQATDEYVPEDVSKPFTPGKLETAKPPGQQSSTGQDLMQFAKIAAAAYGAGASTGGAIRRHYEYGGGLAPDYDGPSMGSDMTPDQDMTPSSAGLAPDPRPASILEDNKKDDQQKVQSAQINTGVMQPNVLATKDQASEDAQKVMQLAAMAAAAFAASDRRLKDNIEPIGKLFDGQNVYRYNFKGDDKKQIGLMAQEVEKRYPDAVGLAPRRGYQEGGRPAGGLAIPDEYRTMVEEVAAARGIPPHVLAATLRQESGFNPEARGRAGEIGLGQILPSTARDPGFGLSPVREEDLRDPRRNIDFAASYIAARNPNVDWNNPVAAARALAANYNAGGDPRYAENVIRFFPGVTEEQIAQVRTSGAAPAQGGGLAPPQGQQGAAAETSAATRTMQEGPDWLQRNERWLVPLVTGLGTMASSPSRYLGSAVLQGLMGAGQAYQGQLTAEGMRAKTAEETKKIAEEAKLTRERQGFTQAQTQAVYAGIAAGAESPDRRTVRIFRNGRFTLIPREEFDSNQQQYLLYLAPYTPEERAELQRQTSPGTPAPTTQGAPPSREPPTGGGQPAPDGSRPDATVVPPATVPTTRSTDPVSLVTSLPEETRNLIDQEIRVTRRLTPNEASRDAAAIPSSQDVFTTARARAQSASGSLPDRLNLAKEFMALPDEGIGSLGRANVFVTPMLSWANSTLRLFNVRDPRTVNAQNPEGQIMQLNPRQLAGLEAIDKETIQAALDRQGMSGSRAFAELNKILSATPNTQMTRESVQKILAGNFMEEQRAIDLDNFTNLWRNYALRGREGGGSGVVPTELRLTGPQVEREFNRLYNPAQYNAEKAGIEKILDSRVGGRPLIDLIIESRGAPSQQMVEYMNQYFADAGGARLLRYFYGR